MASAVIWRVFIDNVIMVLVKSDGVIAALIKVFMSNFEYWILVDFSFKVVQISTQIGEILSKAGEFYKI